MTTESKQPIHNRITAFVRNPRPSLIERKWRVLGLAAKLGFPITRDHKRLAQYKDVHKGRIGFLIGNGPSVRIEDLELLQDEITFVCNRFHLAYDKMAFRPLYTLSSDKQMIDDFGDEIVLKSVGTVFLSWVARPNVVGDFVWVRQRSTVGFSQNPFEFLSSGGATLVTALQLGYFMGIRQFVLYGVDHSFQFDANDLSEDVWRTARGDGNHFIAKYRSGKAWCPPNVKMIEDSFVLADNLLRSQGGWLLNATHGGKLNVLERVDFSGFIANH